MLSAPAACGGTRATRAHACEFRLAAFSGDVALVGFLLAEGTDPDAAGRTGRSALMMAAAAGHLEVCRTLLEAGADPNRRDDKGHVALDYGVRFKRYAVAALLNSFSRRTDDPPAGDWEELPSATEPHDPTVRLHAADLFARIGSHIPVDDSHDWPDVAAGTDLEEEPFRTAQHLADLHGFEVTDLRDKGGCYWVCMSPPQCAEAPLVTAQLRRLGFRFAAGRGYWKK